MKHEIDLLGQHVKDVITGFTGVVTGHCVYMTGCNQSLVVPKAEANGSFREGHWFDDQRLQLAEGGKILLPQADASEEHPGPDRKPSRNY